MASKNVTRSFTLRSLSAPRTRQIPANSAVTLLELPGTRVKAETLTDANAATTLPTRKRKAESSAPSPRKAKAVKTELDVPHPAPKNWKEVYALIEEMRRGVVAAVDTMGCHTSMLDVQEEPRVSFIPLPPGK